MSEENPNQEKRPTADERRPADRTVERDLRVARAESWLLFGGVLLWKAVGSLVKGIGRTARKESMQTPHPPVESDFRKSEEPRSLEQEAESQAGRLLVHGAEASFRAAQVSVAALDAVIEKHEQREQGRRAGESERAEDRNLDQGISPLRQERVGTVLVACAIAVMAAAGFGFLFIYWTGGSNMLLGGNLALFLAGAGAALVLWSHWLTAHKEAVAPREPAASSPRESAAAAVVFRSGVEDVQRRRLLTGMGVLGTGFIAAFVVSLMKSMGFAPDTTLYSRVWQRGQRLMSLDNTPVSINSLRPGSMMLVFPEGSIGSEKAQTVLLRVREDLLRLPAERKNWAPEGYLAYSRVCTHAGCAVGMYETTTHLLMCPCHQSTFDVLNGAQPTGGPAARPLPQLPLYADSQGILHAGDGFSAPPGPGFWGMP